MDCRGRLVLGLCLLLAAVGCQHQVTTITPANSLSLPGAPPVDSSQIKKATSLPKKDPPPLVLVARGDCMVGEALSADLPPGNQQQLREDARQDYLRALKIDPKCVPAYQGLARLYTVVQDHNQAIETYHKGLEIAPENAVLWYELGMNYNYQHDWNQALECLDRAAQLDPGNRSYRNTLAVVLAEAGRVEDSLSCFVRANGEAMGYLRLAQTLQRLRQPELSRRYREMALQKDPNLAATLAMRNEATGAPIQRTSYQVGGVSKETVVPAAQPTPNLQHAEE